MKVPPFKWWFKLVGLLILMAFWLMAMSLAGILVYSAVLGIFHK